MDPFGYPYDDFCRIRVNGLENCSQMDLLLFFFLGLIRRGWMEPRFSHACGRAELTCHVKTRRRRGTFVDEINFATNFIQIQSHRKEGAKTDPEAGCVLSPVWTAARQAPLSMGFSRQEYWGGLLCPPPGDLPNSGLEPRSPALQADSSRSEAPGKPQDAGVGCSFLFHLSYQGSPLRWVKATNVVGRGCEV